MSPKYALIFALAALCCLVATEAATLRRNVVERDDIDDDGKTSVQEVEERQEQEEHEQEIEQGSSKGQVLVNENRNTNTANNSQKETVIRSSNADDARARRVVRRGRRRGGNRRNNRRGRRGGRRRGARKGRGGRPSNQIRRRVGRPVQG